MRYKSSVCIIATVLALFVVGNYVIWKTWTEDLLTSTNYTAGDLTRMGYLLGYKILRKKTLTCRSGISRRTIIPGERSIS